MNLLCIYPGMTPLKNENASVLIALQKRGWRIIVITSSTLQLKGVGRLPPYENMCGVQIHRPFRNQLEMFLIPEKGLKKIIRATKKFEPDIIFCSQELNIRLALLLKRWLKKPIVILTEDAGSIANGNAYKKTKEKLLLSIFRIPFGPKFWRWLVKKSIAIITCHPRDRQHLATLSQAGRPVFYVPWPTNVIPNIEYPESKNRHRGVYIGSLYPFKNTQEFERTLPLILEKTPTEEFIVVGPGPHEPIIKRLQETSNAKIKHLPELPRSEALKLIASSYYAYTPVTKGGWGFIGDCWNMKTPLIMTHNEENYVINNFNALVSNNDNSLIENINALYKNPKLYARIVENGYKEALSKQPETVANSFQSILTDILKEHVIQKSD
jgi:glycosyltransferase involved in cell wall biosynthesis